MRLGAYVFLLFSISVILHFLGYQDVLSYIFDMHQNGIMEISCTQEQQAEGCVGIINLILEVILSPTGVLTTIGLAGLFVAALITGFSAMYLIPLLILLAILNLLVFPFSFIFDGTMPVLISTPLILFFNFLTILTITNFVRGGAV